MKKKYAKGSDKLLYLPRFKVTIFVSQHNMAGTKRTYKNMLTL